LRAKGTNVARVLVVFDDLGSVCHLSSLSANEHRSLEYLCTKNLVWMR
jgi:hypothetical protein